MDKKVFSLFSDLHTLNLSIWEKEKQIQAGHMRLNYLQGQDQKALENLEKNQSLSGEYYREIQRLEADLQLCEEKIAKAKNHLHHATTLQQAKAGELEMAHLGPLREELEQKLLSTMGQWDQCQSNITQNTNFRSGLQETIAEAQEEAKEESAQILLELVGIREDKHNLFHTLDPVSQQHWINLEKRFPKTSPLAKIQSGRCEFCHTNVGGQIEIQVSLSRALELCPSCQRLFIPSIFAL